MGLFRQPLLATLLFLATFVGKPLGVFALALTGKMDLREGCVVGVGLNAQLITEIIVAQLLLKASLIDVSLFTALVAASSLSTLCVPLLLAFILRRWGQRLRHPSPLPSEESHDGC